MCVLKVKSVLQTEEDLNNLREKKKTQLSRKANVDTRLRTAIKSQLDGIKTGLTQLDAAVNDIQKVDFLFVIYHRVLFQSKHNTVNVSICAQKY